MAITKVSSGVISANAVTATIVAENVITSSEIATNGVGTLQIADDAVTSAKLDTNIDIAGTLDVTGVLTADSNVVIAGNLTVNGTTVTNSATNTTIEDALIELGTGTTGTPANDAGIIIERGDSNNAFMGFDESADKFIVATTTATGASTGDLTLTAAPLVTGALTASGLSYPTSDGSANQVIKTDGSGNLSFVTAITDGAVVHNYTATGDGSTTTFDTGINPQDEVNTWVHIDGVYQNKSEYSYNGTSITFSTAPDSGAAIDVITGNQNGFSTADSVLGVYSTTTTDTATYDTGLSASTENNVNIFIEGVYQPKSTYTWSGSTITFDANTPTGLALEVIASKTLTSGAVVTGSITDSAVTTAKIADNAITSAKIVNNSITGADISATTNIVANTFTGALTGNVTGNVTGNLTGTIQTAAQANITSVGTLTGFTSTGIDDNATSTAIIIDSSGRVNIGKTTAVTGHPVEIQANAAGQGLGIYGRSSDDFSFLGFYENGANIEKVSLRSDGGALAIKTSGTEAMRIDSSQRIGIGTSSPTEALSIESNDGLVSTTSNVSKTTGVLTGGYLIYSGDGSGAGPGNRAGIQSFATNSVGSTYDLRFYTSDGSTNLAERMRIDSSGNLLVGTTDTTPYNNTSGNAILLGDGLISSAQEGGNAAIFNRMTSDGSIVGFRKNGSSVGSIGTAGGGAFYISDAVYGGLGFSTLGAGDINPVNTTGGIRDAAADLGQPTARFKDLYLSGGAYIGGTGSANHLDDYEEGTWTVTDGSGAGLSFTVSNNRYTKVGRLVVASAQVLFPTTSSSAYAQLNVPFTSVSSASEHGGVVTEQNYDTNNVVTASMNSTTAVWFRVNGGTALTNANLSGKKLRFTVTYHAA